MLRGDNRASYNFSTNSYDYHSSLGGESDPPTSSIVDNLHALSINIQRREMELEMQAKKKHIDKHPQVEMKAKEKDTDKSMSNAS